MVVLPWTSPVGRGVLRLIAAAAPPAARAITSRAITVPSALRVMLPPLLRRLSMSTLPRDCRSMLPPLLTCSWAALKRKLSLPLARPSTEPAAVITRRLALMSLVVPLLGAWTPPAAALRFRLAAACNWLSGRLMSPPPLPALRLMVPGMPAAPLAIRELPAPVLIAPRRSPPWLRGTPAAAVMLAAVISPSSC